MARRKFDDSGYPADPHDVDEHVWFYVDKKGLVLAHRLTNMPAEISTIPWRMIKRALADHEKATERRK